MFQSFKRPFPSIKFNYTSTKEIEAIIKSLKTEHSHGYDKTPKNFPAFLRNPIVHYHIHKSPSLAPIHSQMNQVHTIPIIENVYV
jgi:hypothetical protein